MATMVMKSRSSSIVLFTNMRALYEEYFLIVSIKEKKKVNE